MTDHLAELSEQGVSIWLDDLSRQRIQSGGLKALLDKHVVGVTTNPSIFQAAMAKDDAYDDDIASLAKQGKSVDEVVRQLTGDDVRAACDILRPVFEATDGLDGCVSYEVEPNLARDTHGTIAQARDLWAAVDRPNLYIKIPATEEGVPAIRQVLSEGINVNVTLIFSTTRYAEVMEAYLSALEERVGKGEPIARLSSVASFFVSRVDSEIDKRLLGIDTDQAKSLLGKAAVANARVAYEKYLATFAGPRWEALQAAGAKPQRPLWASTGVKNPDYPDTMYVTDLVAAGVVNTMPEPTLDAVADHGKITGDTITTRLDSAHDVLSLIAGVGIDLEAVTVQLEDEGLEKFATAWNDLLSGVGGKVEAAR
jgi:transaldolase